MTVLSELGSAALIDAQRTVDSLLRHATTTPAQPDPGPFAFNDVSNPLGGNPLGGNPLGGSRGGDADFAQLGEAIPEIYAAYGAWLEASGNFADIHSKAGLPGYHAQTGGFLAGLAQNVTPDAALGIALGYDHVNLSEDDTHSSGTDDIGRIALYGAENLGPVTLSAVGGLGYDAISTARPLLVGTAKEGHGGLEADLGGEISSNLALGAAILLPAGGLEYTNLREGSFRESGATGADLNGASHGTGSLQPFVGITIGAPFGFGAWSLTPFAHVTYRYDVLQTRRSLIVAAQDGTSFNDPSVAGARDTLDTGAGISAQATPDLQVYGAYDVAVGFGFGTDQSVTAGVKYKF